MTKFKKFASKAFKYSLELLEAAAQGAQQGAQARVPAPRATAATAATATTATAVATKSPAVTVEINPVEWVSHCPHGAGICDNCLTRIKKCIQFAVDSGVPGGFNFATGQIDRDVAECNNACTHKLINDCCATCLFSFMGRKTNEFQNFAALSMAAVGNLNNAATGVGSVGAPISTLRQDVHQRSVENERQRAILNQQMANTPIPFASGGIYGSGGGTWDRQQRMAVGFGYNNVIIQDGSTW